MLICSGVIERTLTNMAYKLCVTSLVNDKIERIVPFDLQASSADAGVTSWWLVLELAGPQGVGDEAEEGIPGFDGLDARMDRGFEGGILGMAAVAAV